MEISGSESARETAQDLIEEIINTQGENPMQRVGYMSSVCCM